MTRHAQPPVPPILHAKHYRSASVFNPENLLREARRQKNVPDTPVPEVCILDPDGDIVRYLQSTRQAQRVEGWACYHSDILRFTHNNRDYGIVGCAVGRAIFTEGTVSPSRPIRRTSGDQEGSSWS